MRMLGVLAVLVLIATMSTALWVGGESYGIGISGTFYRYHYVAPPNTTISGPDIYVVVFNQGERVMKVKMDYEVKPPSPFIVLRMHPSSFTLSPDESRKVLVEIEVLDGAAPGNYSITVSAVVVIRGGGGSSVAVPVGGMRATLTVVGPSSRIRVAAVDLEGRPVRAYLRLFRITSKGNYTVAESQSGVLETVVAPGRYLARAYLGATPLNSTVIQVAPGEERDVKLVVKTVYFESFGVVKARGPRGELGFIEAVAVVNNLYAPLHNVSIVLVVKHNGGVVDRVEVVSLPLLPKGRSEYKFKYVPSGGWRSGVYTFQMQLLSGGVLYAVSSEEKVRVSVAMATPREQVVMYPPIQLLVAIAVGGAAATAAIMLASRRRRRRE